MGVEYRDSAESKQQGITYHLAVVDDWERQHHSGWYAPATYGADGFIHCANGLDLLIRVANSFYRESTDRWLVLVLDARRIESPWRYDDPDETFPHIYGPLNTSAVVAHLPVGRAPEGTFIRLGSGD